MKLRLLISISLFALALQTVCAESADDFFHSGAQSYLSNNVAGARQEVDKGLKLFPGDAKLKKLDELLKQQQQQQSQQQQQKNQQQQNSKESQSQSKQEQQKQQSEQQKQNEQQKQQQQQNQNKDQQKQGEDQKQKDQQSPPGQMTPEEAKRLLDSQKNDEALLPNNQNDRHDREHSLKDW